MMQAELRAPGDLTRYANNPKKHSASQIRQIARSITEWGFTLPILIDEANGIIAGHGRVEAAIQLEMAKIPVVVASGWSAAKKRAYVIADNKLAERSSWNSELLKAEIDSLLGKWDRSGLDDLLGFDESDVSQLFGTTTDQIVVPPGEGSPGRKSTSCKVGSLKIACTGEERDLIVQLAEKYLEERGMMAGFVGWLSQLDAVSQEASARTGATS